MLRCGLFVNWLCTHVNLQDINDDAPGYEYQMTSNSFRVDDDGFLVVNERGLDRDPPNESTLSFQVHSEKKNLLH